ncbi:MAG: acetoacetate decarboxylase family protein [Deltaproteobacteria bacterium]|nr:acetoacetate decarboxylase family protein [Deltaproteobacteria bacterium]
MASLLDGLRSFASLAGRTLYEDAWYLVVDVALDARHARAFLPPGLDLVEPAVARVFVARFARTSFGSVYDEAGVLFHVRRRLRRGLFSPWMVVTDDVALVLGREVLGYPKKLAEIDLRVDGDEVHAHVARRGQPLLSLDATLGDSMRATDAPAVLGPRAFNVRGGFGPRALELVTFAPRERAREVRHATARLVIHPTAKAEGDVVRDPLAALGLGRVLGARLHRIDIHPSLPPRVVRGAGLAFAMRSLGARYL